MGKRGLPSISDFAAAVLVLVWSAAAVCNGGKTSAFVRRVEESADMPLDSDVFKVPSGYNAPQQVSTVICSFPILIVLSST